MIHPSPSVIKKAVFLLLISPPLVGQPKIDDYDVKMGSFFRVSTRSVPVDFIGNDESGFYLAYARGKLGNGELSLAKFGYNLQLAGELKLDQRIGREEITSSTIFMQKGKLYHFLSSTVSGAKNIYLQEIDKYNLRLRETKLVTTVFDSKNAYSTEINVHFSRDSSHLVLVYVVPNKRKENKKLGIHLFNQDMEELWNKVYEFPYQNKLLDLISYRVDGNGDLYVLGKRFHDKRRESVSGEVNYDHLLFGLGSDGVLNSFQIASQGKFLKDMQIDISPGGDIVSAGFYSTRDSYRIRGAYYMRIDNVTREVVSSSFKEFDSDFLTLNMTEKQAAKAKKRIDKGKKIELPFYYIDEFITDQNGHTRIIGESRNIYTVQTNNQYGITTDVHYDFDDMVVVDINPDGDINWSVRIAKNQHTINDGAVYSSYSYAVRDDELYFIFNDNIKNLNYNGVGRVAPMSKGSLTMVMVNRLDGDGKMKRAPLFNRAEIGIKIRPTLCRQLNENEMLLFGHKELKTQRFILLKFN